MALLAVDGLSKSYDAGHEPAVKDVSFVVNDGEVMVLLGPSGCGKSSVLRMIAGIEPVTSGSISIDGRIVSNVPPKDRDIAMVFQSYALYPHMDVYENLAFGLRRRRVPAAELDRRVRAAADKLGLTPYLKRKPQALSGGQRQRVALGRAMVRNPKIFLFDEPLSNLDAALRVTMRNELIKQQAESGTTTVYVTHDQVEAMTMGDRICIMNGGRVVQIGRPLEVYRNPANTFVARFLGNPQMNILPARFWMEAGTVQLHVAGNLIPISGTTRESLAGYSGLNVLVGIRPEDLYDVVPRLPLEQIGHLQVTVIAVEPLGPETIIVLSLVGSHDELIARVGRETRLRSGDQALIYVDVGALSWFDPETSHAIPRPCGAGACSAAKEQL